MIVSGTGLSEYRFQPETDSEQLLLVSLAAIFHGMSDEKKGHNKTGAQKPLTESQEPPKGERVDVSKAQEGPKGKPDLASQAGGRSARYDSQAAPASRSAAPLKNAESERIRSELEELKREAQAEIEAKANRGKPG